MQVVVKGKNMEVSDKLRQFVENKISRLERVLPSIAEAEVELSSERTRSAGTRSAAPTVPNRSPPLISRKTASPTTASA